MSPASLRGSHAVYDPSLSRTPDMSQTAHNRTSGSFKLQRRWIRSAPDPTRFDLTTSIRARPAAHQHRGSTRDRGGCLRYRVQLCAVRSVRPLGCLPPWAALRWAVAASLCPSLRGGRPCACAPSAGLSPLDKVGQKERSTGHQKPNPAALRPPRLREISTKDGFSTIRAMRAFVVVNPFVISGFRPHNPNCPLERQRA